MNLATEHFKKYHADGGADNFRYWKGLVEQRRPKSKSNKCIILRPDAIGDYVLFTPYLAGLKAIYAEYEFILIGTAEVCYLAQASGVVGQCLIWDRHRYERRGVYWREWLRKVSQLSAEILIYPCHSREANADEMAAVAKARVKTGIRGDDCNISAETARYNERFYTNIMQLKENPRHESERNRSFLEALNGRPMASLPLWTEKDMTQVASFFAGRDFEQPFIAIAPGASTEYKCWPHEKFLHVIDRLLSLTNGTVFLLGGPHEAAKASWLRNNARHPERIVSLVGLFTIRETAAFVSKASIFIGNDSALSHIAGAQGIPGHVITGGAHFGRFFPNPETPNLKTHTKKLPCFGCNWNCTKGTTECIVGVDIDCEQILHDLQKDTSQGNHNADQQSRHSHQRL